MNYLAIDYGLKNIGLAISVDSPLAEPLSTLQPKSHQHALETVIRIINLHQINQIIIGLPTGKVKPSVEKFIAKIQSITQLPITLVDEQHTSKQAQSISRQAGKTPSKIKQQEHQIAAAVILQTFLDQTEK